ncbi:hypothetical protein [Paludibacterium yongneupense]|uniref:hypothetical protein n=1 Tax=Paludibacterium yongneupense TaxID=400061 RepID=UPI0003FE7095|nr:hypothetical protein [Paludibacterium yongneupense]
MNVADLLFLAGIVCVLICVGLSALGAMHKGQRLVDDFFSPFLDPDELTHPTASTRQTHAGVFFWVAATLFVLSYFLR